MKKKKTSVRIDLLQGTFCFTFHSPSPSGLTNNHLIPRATTTTYKACNAVEASKPGARYSVHGRAYSSGVRIRRRVVLMLYGRRYGVMMQLGGGKMKAIVSESYQDSIGMQTLTD
jgi:hypothetical protein